MRQRTRMSSLTLGHPPAGSTSDTVSTLTSTLLEMEHALDNLTADANARGEVTRVRRDLARRLSSLDKRGPRSDEIQRVLGCHRRLLLTEVMHEPPHASDLDWLNSLAVTEWPGLLAAMMLTPSWRWPKAPRLGVVPDWLWGNYTHWLFAPPRSFLERGEADQYATHFGTHVEELSRWTERNAGSKAVRAAMEAYLSIAQLLPLIPSAHGLKQHVQSHARILATAMGAAHAPVAKPAPREGRRLRVGFLASHAASIPSFAQLLDSERFEVFLYAFEGVEDAGSGADVAVAAILSLLQADNRTQKCQQLPGSLAEQLAQFRDAQLDVAFFVEELALATTPLAQLATARIAPLQIASTPSAVSTGMLDLFALPGEVLAPAVAEQFSERVAKLPVTGHVFEPLADTEVTRKGARTALGIADDAFVIVTAARLMEITSDVVAVWAGLLRRVPNAIFVVQLLQAADLSRQQIEQFGNAWDMQLRTAGVAPERGLILANPIGSLAELQAALIVGDLFLDAAAFGEPDLLHVPLSLGLPVVAQERKTMRGRMGTALLRSFGLNDLVAGDDAHLHEMLALLASDANARDAVTERVRAAMSWNPICRDGLAAAEAFGHLAERAYDELLTLGARKFRSAPPLELVDGTLKIGELLSAGATALANLEPQMALRNAREVLRSFPANPEARMLAGRAYLQLNQLGAATDYLLAAVETVDDAAAWLDLAKALHRNGRGPQAVQALETSLRLDGRRADAWVMLIEIANASGAADMARDALDALRECAPDDPRLPQLTAAVGQAA